jgi:PIN domain nuclease of toxin-antitoxin system
MFLIDTHILLWSCAQPSELLAKEKKVLIDRNQKIFVSAASIWEIAIKTSMGKLSVPDNLQEYIAQLGFEVLPIDFKAAWNVKDLPAHHTDPFDRLIIATARLHNLTLISRDKIFKNYDVELF